MSPTLSSRSITTSSRTGSALLDVWIFFNLTFNTILLPLLVGTFFLSKKAKRHPTLVNLCITWIASGISSLLLFYAKRHVGPEPSKALCIAQTSLLYGITPMWSVSVFMLFWYMAISICGDLAKSMIGTRRLIFMLASPYVAQISFSLAALIMAVQHPDHVSRDYRVLYCEFKSLALHAMTLFTFIMCIGIIMLEIHLAMIAYRNWCCLRDAGKHNGVDYQFIIRVLTFGIFVALGIVANIILMFDSKSVAPDVYAAIAGSAVFLVFGTQADVIRVWCFWLPPPPAEPQIVDPAQELRRNSFWRRSEPSFKATYDIFEDLPPPPPPKDGLKKYTTRTAVDQCTVIGRC
ncbi:hypothetical protein HYPSUDRAFT_754647 [Hypholoma sublateritium FD-334 SS-4]|uniref:G-protein coupled receptors family 1 profile domain-containing protein n=1 Tax=Hypholoma sublateritium (strain FD-334 SS-4) TaxID=945553 RepID=A0A0D2PN12_HYPSF|nr:hypothetical protein HYPSUDRAFT_754647 [Hypholoma sublateritium FD-334 SS-4]